MADVGPTDGQTDATTAARPDAQPDAKPDAKIDRAVNAMRARVAPRWSDERARRVERDLGVRRRWRAMRRTVLAALVLITLGSGGLVWLRGRADRPAPSLASDRGLRFADGSRAQPLDVHGELRLIATEPPTVELVRGGARFDVVHEKRRTFRVRAGQVTVEVLGTQFVVEESGARVWVAVESGAVRVRWGSSERVLTDGQGGLFPPAQPAPDDARAGVPAWRALADRGDWSRAYAALKESELRDAPDDLLRAADVARLSGHPGDAVEPLRQVLAAHRDDPRAELAAFTLGRVLLDELSRPREAAQAFAEARALDDDGPLAGDALAREVEAWAAAGDRRRAHARAEEYLQRYPDGNRLGSVRRHGGTRGDE